MRKIFTIGFLLLILIVKSQETKKMTFSGKSYDVELGKSYDGDTDFKTILLKDSISIWYTITKLIADKKITAYKPVPVFYSKIKTIKKVELTFTTWEGYTKCTNVPREYVKVEVNDMEDHFILIKKSDFELVLKTFEKGKYTGLGSGFLYETNIKYINEIIFE